MIPAENPEKLEARVRAMMTTRQVRGFLLSGGSNRRNEIAYERYLPAVARLKRDYPALDVAAHTGLIDLPRAHALAEAGIDVAMIDIIGAEETIRDVYHLDRPVADFEASLAAWRTCAPMAWSTPPQLEKSSRALLCPIGMRSWRVTCAWCRLRTDRA